MYIIAFIVVKFYLLGVMNWRKAVCWKSSLPLLSQVQFYVGSVLRSLNCVVSAVKFPTASVPSEIQLPRKELRHPVAKAVWACAWDTPVHHWLNAGHTCYIYIILRKLCHTVPDRFYLPASFLWNSSCPETVVCTCCLENVLPCF